MGLLVWLLVNQLRRDQNRLTHSLQELEFTRDRLLIEERLAAVGRLSSAVAHEIRNPVAIIASSLVTAERPEAGEQQRKEMYSIARSEAARLEKLTSDFLSYARPIQPQLSHIALAEILGYIAEIAKVQANKKNIRVLIDGGNGDSANLDREQIQSALLNLVLNAIDAAPFDGTIAVRSRRLSPNKVELEVENEGNPISPETLSRIFEPFYTTKPSGTGLGLAISRNIARAHGGELTVTRNDPGHICFTMTVLDDNPVVPGARHHG
jgi:signal transduction histidine kinase